MSRKKMTLFILGVAIIAVALGGFFWYRKSYARACNPPLPQENIQVGSSTFKVEMAVTLAEQSCGLSGRTELADGTGMIFLFGSGSVQNFWMKDMNFPLDMIWISKGKVVGFVQDAPAPAPSSSIWSLKIYTSPWGVDTVLEVPAGTVAKNGIKVGDVVTGT